MIKLLGSLMIISASLAAGSSYIIKLHERVRLLTSLKQFTSRISRMIAMSMPEYEELFCGCEGAVKPIADAISDHLENGSTPCESVRAAFAHPYAARLLKDGEREYLTDALSSIGEGDLECVQAVLDDMESVLSSFIEDAAQYEKKNRKAGFALSLYIGLAAAIILM